MTLLIGVDVGTSGLKAIAVDAERGAVVASSEQTYPLLSPRQGYVEQDPDDFVSAAVDALRHVVRVLGARSRGVRAIGLTGQMHSAVLLDKEGAAVRPAILWCDTRTTAECDHINAVLGFDGLRRAVGNRALPGFTLPKLLWLRAHEPRSFERAARVVMPKDFLGFYLSGEIGADVSDASGTLVFDPGARRLSDKVLAAFDLPRSLFPEPRESTQILGRLLPSVAETVGLPAGIPVIRGAADNAASAVGLGVTKAGRVMVSIGTSGVVLAHTDEYIVEPDMRLHSFCHAVPGRYYLMGVMLSAGGALRFYRDVLCDGERLASEIRGVSAYEIIADTASTAREGAGGVVFLPYLMGERTPHNDAAARGALIGLTASTTKADISRAVLEGITFGLCDALDLIRDSSPQAGLSRARLELRLSGGGAKSPFWRRLMANIFGEPVAVTTSLEGAAFGAAILAGSSVGVFASVEEGADALVHVTSRIDPDAALLPRYREIHAVYRGLYGDLRERFRSLGALS